MNFHIVNVYMSTNKHLYSIDEAVIVSTYIIKYTLLLSRNYYEMRKIMYTLEKTHFSPDKVRYSRMFIRQAF